MKKANNKMINTASFLTMLACLFFIPGTKGQTVKKNNTVAQSSGSKTKWTQDPYDNKVFIENRGQFNDAVKSSTILFGAQMGNTNAYFTAHGVTFKYLVQEAVESGKDPDQDGPPKRTMHTTSYEWVGSNPSVSVKSSDELSYYYTYPKGNKGTIKTNIFRKITYRNLYPGIDAEYTFPADALNEKKYGVKYALIVHPGADLSKVKIKYNGVSTSTTDAKGNVIWTSELGNLTDYAPESYYEGNMENTIPVSYKVAANEESFLVNADYDKSKTVIIDPWTTSPAFTSTNIAYILDYDYAGNVYAYGGPGGATGYQLVKFNNTGIKQWMFNASTLSSTGNYIGGMCCDRKSECCYMSEGWNSSGGGSRIEKVSPLGLLMGTDPGNVSMDEIWRLIWDPCTQLVFGVGNGTCCPYQACQIDTNMILMTIANICAPTVVSGGYHDFGCLAMDPVGGNMYTACSQSLSFIGVFNNYIVKCPIPALVPAVYQVPDHYAIHEFSSYTFNGGTTNGFSGLAASPNWVYMYQGDTLKQINKVTGAVNAVAKISATPYQWGGLDVDYCDDIYLGNSTSLQEYNSSLTLINTFPLTGTIYDVKTFDTCLYSCGNGFVTAITVPALKFISATFSTPSNCGACDGKASVTINCGGVPPYSYLWSNGSTGIVDSNLCAGKYNVTVTDAACPAHVDTASFLITGKPGYTATVTDTNPDCGFKKGNLTIYPTGGSSPYTYNWSNGETNQKDTGLSAGTYSITITDNTGCKFTLSTTLINPTSPVINITPSPDSVCLGSSTTLKASGAKTYLWNPGALIGNTVTVSPVTNTTYTVNALDSNGCTGSATITVVVNALPVVAITPPADTICLGSGVTITASGASTYSWSPPVNLSCLTCPNPLATPTVTTTYTVVGKNGHGCIDSSKVKIVVNPATVATITVKPSSDTICAGDSAMLVGGGGGSYDWTFSGSPKDTVWVKPGSSTIYTLQVTKNGCIATVNAKIIVIGASTPKITVSKDSICKGDSTMLTASGGSSYKWLVPGNPTSASIWVKPGANATYSVVVTTPCGKDTITSKLIHVLPYPVIIPSANKTICIGNNTSISATGGTTYLWSPGGSTNSTITVNPTKTTVYTVAVSNGLCISDTTITVTVDSPAVLTITPNQKICIGDSTTLTATGGPSYKWSNGATTSSITVAPNTNTTYTCVVNKNGCIDSTSTIVTVDVPALILCCDKTIMPGGSDTIVATGGGNYVWTPSTSLSCSTCDSAIATPTVTTTYIVVSKDAAGCTITKTVTVFVEIPCADFTVPNVFTPNNDGRNDDFVISVLNPSSYSIDIFDRWGKEVYTSTDPTVYWNGKVLNTQYLVTNGVYYYIIKATCGNNTYSKKGFVQVVSQ